jgi:uncharacterized protein YuzE
MSVTIDGVEFDNNFYDAEVDVLYLNVGDPADAIDWDESLEGHGISYGPAGRIVGLTILNARRIVEEDGKLVITLPHRRLEATDLGTVLTPA